MKKEKILAYALKNALEHEGKAKVEKVISSLFHEGLKKNEVGKIIHQINEIVFKVNELNKEEQEKQYKELEKYVSHRKERKGLPPLPRAKKGKVIMRFAPSPSGALHVGHALTACLSFLYVKKYGGKFYMRIEDTNPETIYKPAYNMIKKESQWLFGNKAKIVIQSNNMRTYYRYVEKLIKKKAAYVCTCPQDKFKELVRQKKPCECRKKSVEENLERWKKMLGKGEEKYKKGEAVVRFKSGMKHKNPAFRDFPLMRINETRHPLQGNKYRAWPLMNLSVAVDDIEEGITHIIRAKEHRDNAEKQKMIYKVLEKKYPWVAFVGRIHLKEVHLSSREIKAGIEKGRYRGWDDPRLPTIAAIIKQGKYKPETFYKFAEHLGISEVDKVLDKKEFFRLLDSFNKEN